MCKYTPEQVASAIDLAVLKPAATEKDVNITCQKAARYGCASVCVKPYHVGVAKRYLKGTAIPVCAVVGFPHGNSLPFIKAEEAYKAISDGATEIDAVINISKAREGDWFAIQAEIEKIISACREAEFVFQIKEPIVFKVILETCYLYKNQIRTLCKVCANAGVDFVKTSTGYGTLGATPDTVKIMLEAVEGTTVQVKASGGIHTYNDAEEYLSLGCTRLGSSRVEELLPC